MPENERAYLEEIWRGDIVHTLHINLWSRVKRGRHLAPFIWVSRGRRVDVRRLDKRPNVRQP
jgi:hypothetical protein